MAKKEQTEATTWHDKMKEFGGGNFTFLSTDGESITFIVVGLPALIKTVYKNKEQERIGCPVVTDDGYQLYICGKRVARKLSKHEAVFKTSALMAVRHGAEGDVNSTYEVKVLPEQETFARLDAIRKADFEESMIAESVKEAEQTLNS